MNDLAMLVLIVVIIVFVIVLIVLAARFIGTVRKINKTIDDIQPAINNANKILEDIQPALKRIDPLMERVSLTVDAVNLEIMRADTILADISEVTSTATDAVGKVAEITDAPFNLLNAATDKVRDLFGSSKEKRNAEQVVNRSNARHVRSDETIVDESYVPESWSKEESTQADAPQSSDPDDPDLADLSGFDVMQETLEEEPTPVPETAAPSPGLEPDPFQEYIPAATAEPAAEFIPVPEPGYQPDPSAEPFQEYVPVATAEPVAEFIPVPAPEFAPPADAALGATTEFDTVPEFLQQLEQEAAPVFAAEPVAATMPVPPSVFEQEPEAGYQTDPSAEPFQEYVPMPTAEPAAESIPVPAPEQEPREPAHAAGPKPLPVDDYSIFFEEEVVQEVPAQPGVVVEFDYLAELEPLEGGVSAPNTVDDPNKPDGFYLFYTDDDGIQEGSRSE